MNKFPCFMHFFKDKEEVEEIYETKGVFKGGLMQENGGLSNWVRLLLLATNF